MSNTDVAAPQAFPAPTKDGIDIARQFVTARRNARSLAGFPGTIPGTLADAYRIQDAAIHLFGDSIGGWKVGRIMAPHSTRYGADRLAGPIFKNSIVQAAGAAAIGRIFNGGFGAAEAELLLRIGQLAPVGKLSFSLDEAAALVDRVHIGLEIASSPLATINELGPPVIISDFGNNNGLIVGPEIENWRDVGIDQLPVSLAIDGQIAGRGSAAAFPDGTLGSVRFLLELMARRNIALVPGTWISSGALTGVHDVKPGQRVEATYGEHQTMSVSCVIESALPMAVAA